MPNPDPQDERMALADALERLAERFCLEERAIGFRGDTVAEIAALVLNNQALLFAALRAQPERAAADMRERIDTLELANERLHIAFTVLSESGHGSGMYEVRRWFNSGTEKPIPWPGGACFEAWAEEAGIANHNGEMRLRALPLSPAGEGGGDA